MDPLLLLALGGGAYYLATRKTRKASGVKQTTNLPPGDYQIAVGEEFSLLLPRDTGYWREAAIGSPGGDIAVFSKSGDPLALARVRGESAGPVKVQFYADEARTDLVGEYMFEVIGIAATRRPPTATVRGIKY